MAGGQKSPGVDPVLKELLDRPIAYHRAFARLGGGVTAAVFLSQAFYWHHRSSHEDGWFYKTADEWSEETGLTKYEIREARKHLTALGVIEEKLQGMPAKLHFRVNLDGLMWQLSSLSNVDKQVLRTSTNKIDERRKTSLSDVEQTSFANVDNRDCRTSENLLKEQRLPKTTTDTASPDAVRNLDFILTKRKRRLTGWKLVGFMRFWEGFDFKHGRAEAADAWLDIPDLTPGLVDDIVAAAAVEAKRRPQIEQRGGTPKWAQGWITARRWEDEALRPKRAPSAAHLVVDEAAERRRQVELFNEQMRRIGRPEMQVSTLGATR